MHVVTASMEVQEHLVGWQAYAIEKFDCDVALAAMKDN